LRTSALLRISLPRVFPALRRLVQCFFPIIQFKPPLSFFPFTPPRQTLLGATNRQLSPKRIFAPCFPPFSSTEFHPPNPKTNDKVFFRPFFLQVHELHLASLTAPPFQNTNMFFFQFFSPNSSEFTSLPPPQILVPTSHPSFLLSPSGSL